jgi:hypothetical protein
MIIMKAERVLNLETRARDGCLVRVKRVMGGGGGVASFVLKNVTQRPHFLRYVW